MCVETKNLDTGAKVFLIAVCCRFTVTEEINDKEIKVQPTHTQTPRIRLIPSLRVFCYVMLDEVKDCLSRRNDKD